MGPHLEGDGKCLAFKKTPPGPIQIGPRTGPSSVAWGQRLGLWKCGSLGAAGIFSDYFSWFPFIFREVQSQAC